MNWKKTISILCALGIFAAATPGSVFAEELDQLSENQLEELEETDTDIDDDTWYTDICINEICASNDTCLADVNGNFYDWIELYNMSDEEIDLTGYGVSKKESKPYQLTIPEGVTLGAGEYLVIFCNKNEEAGFHDGALYAPFNIGADGETLTLVDADGALLDTCSFYALKTDDTYGHYPDGDGSYSILTPTPSTTNNDAAPISYVDAPAFSVESGFYEDAFQLEIDAPEGTTIYYTTDCSNPLDSDTAISYRDGILIYDNTSDPNLYSEYTHIRVDYDYTPPGYNIDKGMIIRAVAVDADGFASDVLTKSYFVGKDADYYTDMAVISISTESENLFDDDIGIYVTGSIYEEYISDPDHKVYSSANNASWPTNYNQSGRDWEREATVQLFENGTLSYETGCGIRISGNYSRGVAQKSFKLYARSEYGNSKFKYNFFDDIYDIDGNPITGFEKLQIYNGGFNNDSRKIREALVQTLSQDRDVSAAHYRPCIVFLDGEFWGMYSLAERQDADYLEEHYGIDTDDLTVIKNGKLDNGSGVLMQEYKDFYDWIISADISDDDVYAQACEIMDMQSLMDYMTIETYICNKDWWHDSDTMNWIVWRSNEVDDSNPYADGKWRFILQDVQSSFLTASDNLFETGYKGESWKNFGSIFMKLMENATFRDQFYETYHEIVAENFEPDRVCALIDEFAAEQKDAVVDTYKRFSLNVNKEASYYDSGIKNIKTFAQTRPAYALQYLDELYCTFGDHRQVTDDICDICGEVVTAAETTEPTETTEPIIETTETTEIPTETTFLTTEITTETTPAVTTESSGPVVEFLPGDLDDDGAITPTDAHLCLVAYANLQLGCDTGLTGEQLLIADVNGDGAIDANDAYDMLCYYATYQLMGTASWNDILSL